MLQILDDEGRVRKDLEPALTPDELKRIYGLMVTTRVADGKALKLQRQGRLGTYASSLGHEACQVGTAFSLRKEDWIFPYFRDLGLYLTVGYPLALYYHFWMGNEAGLRTPEGLNLFSLAIPVASQIIHAVGAGMAANYRKSPLAVITTFSDGATSEGDFHEGLNYAGVFKTPTVFVCYNNQWAISTPRKRQTAADTIAQKAFAYGFSGVAVDVPDGLIVPVVKMADQKTVFDIAAEIKTLAEAARGRSLDLADLKGGTFSITNVGVLGGDAATPIINYPEVAILATMRIADRVRAENGRVVIKKTLPLCLSFDHRVVDGAEAARFVNDLKKFLEDAAELEAAIKVED